MALRAYKFTDLDSFNLFLRGGISVAAQLNLVKGRVFGLHGLTLVFSTPSATVTFSDASNEGLTLGEIAAAITTGVAALSGKVTAEGNGFRLTVVENTPTNGVALNGTTSTAGSVFGFSAQTYTGTVYAAPDGTAPRFIATEGSPGAESFIALVDE